METVFLVFLIILGTPIAALLLGLLYELPRFVREQRDTRNPYRAVVRNYREAARIERKLRRRYSKRSRLRLEIAELEKQQQHHANLAQEAAKRKR